VVMYPGWRSNAIPCNREFLLTDFHEC